MGRQRSIYQDLKSQTYISRRSLSHLAWATKGQWKVIILRGWAMRTRVDSRRCGLSAKCKRCYCSTLKSQTQRVLVIEFQMRRQCKTRTRDCKLQLTRLQTCRFRRSETRLSPATWSTGRRDRRRRASYSRGRSRLLTLRGTRMESWRIQALNSGPIRVSVFKEVDWSVWRHRLNRDRIRWRVPTR